MTIFDKKKEFKLALIFQKTTNENEDEDEDNGDFMAINQSQFSIVDESSGDLADLSHDGLYSSPKKQENNLEFRGGHEGSHSSFEESPPRSFQQTEVEI